MGVLFEVAINWLLLWLVEKRHLSALGIAPTKVRVMDFFIGFVLAASCFLVYCLTTTTLTNNHWTIHADFGIGKFASASLWTLNSVAFEELIFRGAMLYILIQKAGVRTACLISAATFGFYHWFSFGVLGDPVQMVYVFFSTGIWGLMFAQSFAKTKSLYLPFGLHLGWNLFSIVIFSQGPLGEQLLINSNNGQMLSGLPSAALMLFQIFSLPAIVYFYLRRKSKG